MQKKDAIFSAAYHLPPVETGSFFHGVGTTV